MSLAMNCILIKTHTSDYRSCEGIRRDRGAATNVLARVSRAVSVFLAT